MAFYDVNESNQHQNTVGMQYFSKQKNALNIIRSERQPENTTSEAAARKAREAVAMESKESKARVKNEGREAIAMESKEQAKENYQ